MHAGPKLARSLAVLNPASHSGDVARRVGLAGLLNLPMSKDRGFWQAN